MNGIPAMLDDFSAQETRHSETRDRKVYLYRSTRPHTTKRCYAAGVYRENLVTQRAIPP